MGMPFWFGVSGAFCRMSLPHAPAAIAHSRPSFWGSLLMSDRYDSLHLCVPPANQWKTCLTVTRILEILYGKKMEKIGATTRNELLIVIHIHNVGKYTLTITSR